MLKESKAREVSSSIIRGVEIRVVVVRIEEIVVIVEEENESRELDKENM